MTELRGFENSRPQSTFHRDPEAQVAPGYLKRGLCAKLLSPREEENYSDNVMPEPKFQSCHFECCSKVVPYCFREIRNAFIAKVFGTVESVSASRHAGWPSSSVCKGG